VGKFGRLVSPSAYAKYVRGKFGRLVSPEAVRRRGREGDGRGEEGQRCCEDTSGR